jgi:hypothetical protein
MKRPVSSNLDDQTAFFGGVRFEAVCLDWDAQLNPRLNNKPETKEKATQFGTMHLTSVEPFATLET